MKKKSKIHGRITVLLLGMFVFALSGLLPALAQETDAEAPGPQLVEPVDDTQEAETVTINVKDANISEVLKAYSLQTGQSIVVGPDVVSENVNVRLNDIPWKEALDVILKPYGFGYRVVGETIVISKLENIVQVEGIEPLASKVFKLKYLDAYDIKEVCEAQLTSRGKFTILSTKGLPGWEFGGSSSRGGGAASDAGIRRRKEREQTQKSKIFVISDVPASLTALSGIIEEMDQMPEQVLIEAKFLEINTGGLTDIGLDYIGAMENVAELNLAAGASGNTLQPTALAEINKILNLTSGFPDPLNMRASGGFSQDDGVRLAHTEIGDTGYEMLVAMMAKDDNVNILSAPRILTLNNQEAAILVGEKYPIISTDVSSAGGSQTQSASLDYYENIGIQLNVIPQICENQHVSMIVHPAVSEINGTISGFTASYPRLNIREAETQVLIQSGNTAVIGGLQQERDYEEIKKVPFLGDIPFLGRLFRRETLSKDKVELLIFIKATIIENKAYADESIEQQQVMEASMRLEQNDVVEELEEVSEEEKEEIVIFINGPSATNEVAAEVESEMDEVAVVEVASETNEVVVLEVELETDGVIVEEVEFEEL